MNKHIEHLLLSNDCVIVPGFGGFMAHHVDARKDISDGSFLPPIRSIGFNPRLTINDSLLAQSYVETYDISYPEAVMRIEDEVRELKQHIEADGKYEFTDIGTVSLNADGNYEFTPCEAGIVSPTLYGLDSFRMKTLSELKSTMQKPAPIEKEENKELEKAEENKEPVKALGNDKDRHTAMVIALWRNIAVACIAIIIFMLIPSPIVNNMQMAGNHINTALLDKVLPKDITTGQDEVSKSVKSEESQKKVAESINEQNTESANNSESNIIKEEYSIVLASRVTVKNATEYVSKLQKHGLKDAFVYKNGHVKVLYGHFPTKEEASKVLNTLNNKQEFAGAWIVNVKF